MNERLEAIVSGRVQMVMYRDYAARKARALGIVGEVKNMSDGTVRIIAEGPRTALQQYLKKLHEGSLFSRVDRVEEVFKEASGTCRSFTITYE